MNLRDQLKEILPDILPRNPNQSIKGTELIEMVKHNLKQEYSDATLRYHFSIMSCDPSSPIAKVEQGQGYYLRTTTIASMHHAMNMMSSSFQGLGDELVLTSKNSDLSIARANKFNAVVQRYFESIQRTPFSFEESFCENAHTNRWLVPDLAVVEWLTGDLSDDGFVLDKTQMQIYRKLGRTPIQISSAKLKLELNHIDVFVDLYQCLATSEWANTGEIIVAASIEDQHLIELVRNFAARYGIGVTSFGLAADVLDDMPEPAAIENLMPREFEAIQSLFEIRRYAAPTITDQFDWQHISRAAIDNEDFAKFERWISSCLLEERVVDPREFADQERSKVTVPTEFVA